jgi:hypothetical protein
VESTVVNGRDQVLEPSLIGAVGRLALGRSEAGPGTPDKTG